MYKRLLFLLFSVPVLLNYAYADARAQQAPSSDTLASYWPFGLEPKTWTLTNRVGLPSMIVTYLSLNKNTLDLIFQHPQNPRSGGKGFNIGQQRYCSNGDDSYLFLDQYVGVNPDGSVRERHHIVSSRLIITPDGESPVDLIANGTYARCGGTGQPYLRWKLGGYRLQAWGYLAESPKDRWYWDVRVDGPIEAVNTCVRPQQPFTAVKVQEAWWTNFDKADLGWAIGSGATSANGVPTGSGVSYGRADFHAKGQMPWYMVESIGGGHLMCASSVHAGTDLPLGQLRAE